MTRAVGPVMPLCQVPGADLRRGAPPPGAV